MNYKKLFRILFLLATLQVSYSAFSNSFQQTPVKTKEDTSISVARYDVLELQFSGKRYTEKDNPVRDIELVTSWKHEKGDVIKVYGFWDGDGRGGKAGSVFKVRFCPLTPGKWTLIQTISNDATLNGQKENYSIECKESPLKGFWIADRNSPGKRWYKRSDGSHPYITGNTMYTFLSEYEANKPTGGNIRDDVNKNSEYFNKIRFGITGDRYVHPVDKPFLDNQGKPTDDGNFSFRPNPTWFSRRVDLAVRTAMEKDVIADMVLNGPDLPNARSVLRAAANNGDCTPFLKYIAARYGSFPNVWICLANEFDIRDPKYTHDEIIRFGKTIRQYLAYPTPLSIHTDNGDWHDQLNTIPAWHDHVIIQYKLKKLNNAADIFARNYLLGGGNKPIINDELAYEGAGDEWSTEDVMEAFLGAFMGGGYGSTGYKTGGSVGHYFTGKFDAAEHKAAKHLNWFRQTIDKNISFWKMKPVIQGSDIDAYIFRKTHPDARSMAWNFNEYLLATNGYVYGATITANLPEGRWQVKLYDLTLMKEEVLADDACGEFTFNAPDSRTALFHFKRKQ